MSHRPLYRLDAGSAPRLSAKGHAGLWWAKFFDGWQPDFAAVRRPPKASDRGGNGGQQDRGGKADWVAQAAGRPVGEKDLLQEHRERRKALVTGLGGCLVDLTLASRLTTGLGLAHPTENGFAWHHSLGVPYIPGSSVKGLVRAWSTAQADESEKKQIEGLFGGPADGSGAGSVIFLDGLPSSPVELAAEVMTPHIGKWLTTDEPEKHAPGDWIDPIPHPFLTVEAGTAFTFAILPRTPDAAGMLEQVLRWLDEALGLSGAGAKTASGYGLFATEAASAAWRDLPEVTISSDLPPVEIPQTETIQDQLQELATGFRIGDRVVMRDDPDSVGKVYAIEDGKVWVEFDDGDREGLAHDDLAHEP